MKFFDFLNEMARISFKKMSAEEIARNALENNMGDKKKTINYLKNYAKFNLEPNSEIYKKIEHAVTILNDGEKVDFSETRRRRTTTKEETKKENTTKEENTSTENIIIQGKNFCLTGRANINFTFKKRADVEWDIITQGGAISEIKYANVLVCASLDSTSTKMIYAKRHGIKIITYQQLYAAIKYEQENEKRKSRIHFEHKKTPEEVAQDIFEQYDERNGYNYINYKFKNSKNPMEELHWRDVYAEWKKLWKKKETKEKREKKKTNTFSWTMDDILKEVDNLLMIDSINMFEEVVFIFHKNDLNERIQKALRNNDGMHYTFWNEVLKVYTLKYNDAKNIYKKNQEKRKQKEEEQRRSSYHYDTTFTGFSYIDEKTKSLIRKMVFPPNDNIPSKDFSYKKLLMKVHPDFHQMGQKAVATELTKLINANKNNDSYLRQIARELKLLKEFYESNDGIYNFLLEHLTGE